MSKPDEITPLPPPAERGWTRLEDYLDLPRLWRRSSRRNRRLVAPRTEQPAAGLLSIGMLPFLLLMAGMALLSALIIVTAIPGKNESKRAPQEAPLGTAPAGWLDGVGD